LSIATEKTFPMITNDFSLVRAIYIYIYIYMYTYVTSLSSVIRSYRVRVPLRYVPRVSVMSINSSQSDLRKSFSTNSWARSPSAITRRIIAGRSRSHEVSSIATAASRHWCKVELLTCNRKCEEFVD